MYAFLFDKKSLFLTTLAFVLVGLLLFGAGLTVGAHWGPVWLDDADVRQSRKADTPFEPLSLLATSKSPSPSSSSRQSPPPATPPPPREIPPLPKQPKVQGATSSPVEPSPESGAGSSFAGPSEVEGQLSSLFPGAASPAEGGPQFAVCVGYHDRRKLADEVSALIRRRSALPEDQSWEIRVFQPSQMDESAEEGRADDDPPPPR